MTWTIEFDEVARRDLGKLDRQEARRVLRFLNERIAPAEDPRVLGDALKGARLGGLWRYRVGDNRIIVEIHDRLIRVLVVRIGHRREIYRS
ncbi:type II toxin-antitoxin system RelE/ParE family toxin [Thermobifida halotolerans]|uniref:Type II toxin-antitoxin system RelE/ParE family toxin n=1 Tax=Thermobifida halotolerans TaxID=483545 RepID=A0A399FYU0_9ACTN|nr:type II toxin-antitoxin system RelE/ParE family toxin [Thermobifida halotolerans]UOE19397.1 type II toxin-antitoxin system RelE/ParE family toxin [Thermobifida halotolerans]